MSWYKHRRVLASVALAIFVSGLAFSQVAAQGARPDIRSKFRSGDSIVISAGEVVPHDLYLVGGTVRVEGRVEGDLFVAGGTIDITGPVTGDLFIGGGTVNVSSTVGRHLRVGGGNVSINGPVQLDALVGAGTLVVGSAARIEGDLIFSAGQTTLNGAVAGSVLGSTQVYAKAGTVAGVEEVNLVQTQPAPAPEPAVDLAAEALDQVQRYVGIVIAGALLLWLTPGLMQAAAVRIREQPLPTFGAGALGFVGFFPAMLAVVIAMILIAIPLGFLGLGRLVFALVAGVLLGSASLGLAFALLLMFIAAAVVGLSIGQLGMERTNVLSGAGSYVALALGVLAIVIATAIPIVGWWVNAVVVLFGLGALLVATWRRVRRPAALAQPAASGPSSAGAIGPLATS